MATTPYTEEDKKLLACLPECQEQLRKQIDVGRPYVWELRLSLEQFYILETAIADSISSHSNDYHHLLSEDFAVILVMYLAEWYKRFYKGADTIAENGGYPPTQNGDIRSLFWLFSLMALQN